MPKVKIKEQRKYRHYLPSTIDLYALTAGLDFAKPTHRDSLAYLIYDVVIRPLYRRDAVKPNGYTCLNSDVLREVLGGDYIKYIRFLERAGIIECDDQWKEGEVSKGYRLKVEHNVKDVRPYTYTSPKLLRYFRRIEEFQDASKRKYKYLWKWFASGKLTLDRDAACHLIESCKWTGAHKALVNKIIDGDFNFSERGKGKRLYTNLTNLKRELRKLLTYDGEPLEEVDIPNSQPYFLLKFIFDDVRARNGEEVLNALLDRRIDWGEPDQLKFLATHDLLDVAHYIGLVESKMLYGYFYGRFRNRNSNMLLNSNEIKEIFYGVLFGKDYAPTPHQKTMEEEFPRVFRIIGQLKKAKTSEKKKNAYKKASHALQLLESQTVLGVVCKRLAEEVPQAPLFTVHDSILTTKPYLDAVRQIMKEELTKIIGIQPKM